MNPLDLPLGIYQHYKGKHYEVLAVARHSETLDFYVVYKQLYGDYAIWIRPYAMFTEQVEVEGKQLPRFAFMGNELK